jgi:hypothetical protein
MSCLSRFRFEFGGDIALMGVHHFSLSMVPREYFERTGAPVPTVLTNEDIDRGENTTSGWWASLQPESQTLSRLRQLCPTDKSWGETEEFVTGGTWGSDLRIWKDQGRVWLVTFRFSPIADDRTLLNQFVAIARDEHCLLLDTDTGSLFEPDNTIVSERLRDLQAMRFACEPQATVLDAARRTSR